MGDYLSLILISLGITASGIGFYLLNLTKHFRKIPYKYRQLIFGLIFGGFAVIATEFGTDIGGAVINVRDAAPITAGLVFGSPAGIIAGVIGGVHRFFAAFYGKGEYTQIACSVSTLLSGILAAVLRKWMFDNKAPSWPFGIATTIVLETIHMTFIFITHLDEPYECLVILRIVTYPMIIANAVVVFLVTLFVYIYERMKSKKKNHSVRKTINSRIQFWLLWLVMTAAGLSNIFLAIVQNNFAHETAEFVLMHNIADIEERINEYSRQICEADITEILSYLDANPNMTCQEILDKYDERWSSLNQYLSRINFVSSEGFVVDSTDPTNIGYNMNSNIQSQIFHEEIMASRDIYIQLFTERTEDPTQYWKYCGMFSEQQKEVTGFTGYIQFAIDPYQLYNSGLSTVLKDITKARTVYQNGFILIFDYDGVIVSDMSKHEGLTLLVTGDVLDTQDQWAMMSGKIFKEDSDKSFYMYSDFETYYIVTCFPQTDLTNSRDAVIYLFNFISIIVYALIFFVTYFLVEIVVVKNIRSINNSLNLIAGGGLNERIDVHSSIEFDELSLDINTTVDTLKRLIEREAKRLDAELEFARKIQSSSLPSVFPAFPGLNSFDIYATMNPAKQVGGDFYDFYLLNANELAFLVADVSGKGIPASMFMMESKTMLKNLAQSGIEVDSIFFEANNALAHNNDANMFVTCWMGILNIKTGEMEFVNAGHNAPIIYRAKEKKWEYLKLKKNVVLAGFEGLKYDSQTLKLEKGDRIYLYTDGVTEATRGDKTLYGEDRLLEYLNKHKKDSIKEILNGIKKDIDTFIDGAEQADDITMLIIDYQGDK